MPRTANQRLRSAFGTDAVPAQNGLQPAPVQRGAGHAKRQRRDADALARKHSVPVVVEVILEKVTNVSMGTEIDKIVEFESIDCRHPEGTQGLELAGLLE